MQHRTRRPLVTLLLLAIALAATTGCTLYDSPPKATIVGVENGIIADPTAPIVIRFHEPIDPASFSMKIVVKDTKEDQTMKKKPFFHKQQEE